MAMKNLGLSPLGTGNFADVRPGTIGLRWNDLLSRTRDSATPLAVQPAVVGLLVVVGQQSWLHNNP